MLGDIISFACLESEKGNWAMNNMEGNVIYHYVECMFNSYIMAGMLFHIYKTR